MIRNGRDNTPQIGVMTIRNKSSLCDSWCPSSSWRSTVHDSTSRTRASVILCTKFAISRGDSLREITELFLRRWVIVRDQESKIKDHLSNLSLSGNFRRNTSWKRRAMLIWKTKDQRSTFPGLSCLSNRKLWDLALNTILSQHFEKSTVFSEIKDRRTSFVPLLPSIFSFRSVSLRLARTVLSSRFLQWSRVGLQRGTVCTWIDLIDNWPPTISNIIPNRDR